MSQYDRGLVERGLPVIVVDLDSTICDTRPRRSFAPKGDDRNVLANWVPYSMACGLDQPIDGMIRLIQALHGAGNLIFLLSARNDEAERETLAWLLEQRVPFDRLRLRAADEISSGDAPSSYKVDVIQGWIDEGFDVQINIDDWAETCARVTAETGVPSVNPTPPGVHRPGY